MKVFVFRPPPTAKLGVAFPLGTVEQYTFHCALRYHAIIGQQEYLVLQTVLTTNEQQQALAQIYFEQLRMYYNFKYETGQWYYYADDLPPTIPYGVPARHVPLHSTGTEEKGRYIISLVQDSKPPFNQYAVVRDAHVPVVTPYTLTYTPNTSHILGDLTLVSSLRVGEEIRRTNKIHPFTVNWKDRNKLIVRIPGQPHQHYRYHANNLTSYRQAKRQALEYLQRFITWEFVGERTIIKRIPRPPPV
jgi:hypothetical protein